MEYENKEFWHYYNIGYTKRWLNNLLRNINSHKFICNETTTITGSDFIFKSFICEMCNKEPFFIINSNNINITCGEYLIKKLLE